MDVNADLTAIKGEVFREIGKNVVLFQAVEQLLKALNSFGRVQGVVSKFAAVREQRAQVMANKTMGGLVGQFTEEILKQAAENENEAEAIHEASISFSFSLESDDNFYEQQKIALNRIVQERNELIHHFIPKWDWKSASDMRTALKYLVSLRERTEAQRVFLASLWVSFKEGLNDHLQFINSEEGAKQLELQWLQQSKVVRILWEAASRPTRADGWTLVSLGGDKVHELAKEDMNNLRERYGYRSVSGLIAGVELFAMASEIIEGGTRLIYRQLPTA